MISLCAKGGGDSLARLACKRKAGDLRHNHKEEEELLVTSFLSPPKERQRQPPQPQAAAGADVTGLL